MIINNLFKPRVLFLAVVLALSTPVMSNDVEKKEEKNNSITMEDVVSDVSVAFDKVMSDISSIWGKVVTETSTAVKSKMAPAPKAEESSTSSNSCRPILHGDFLASKEYLAIENEKNAFRIDPKGQLFSNEQSIELSKSQIEILKAYQETIRNDLVFMDGYLKSEITNTWKVFDSLFAKELGETSQLRSELNTFHEKLQNDISKAYFVKNDEVHFDHKAITAVIAEFEDAIPSFISNITIRGFTDITGLSANESNKISFIASKVKNLQNQFVADLKTQRNHVRTVRDNMCIKLTSWQEQEQKLSKEIPALANWKSVSFEKKS